MLSLSYQCMFVSCARLIVNVSFMNQAFHIISLIISLSILYNIFQINNSELRKNFKLSNKIFLFFSIFTIIGALFISLLAPLFSNDNLSYSLLGLLFAEILFLMYIYYKSYYKNIINLLIICYFLFNTLKIIFYQEYFHKLSYYGLVFTLAMLFGSFIAINAMFSIRLKYFLSKVKPFNIFPLIVILSLKEMAFMLTYGF
jgi:hypothetical protein